MTVTRLLAAIAFGLTTMPAAARSTIVTPMQGTLGPAFDDGTVHGWGWHGAASGGAGPLIGSFYDNILTINGGAATAGVFGPFGAFGTQAFLDWTATQAQWGDDLHGIVNATQGGGLGWVTSLRYGYMNTLATATHTIQFYDMLAPSASHATNVNNQFGDQLLSLVLTGIPTGAAIVTVTGLSIHVGTAAWIKFGETGPGFPGTFWLSGGVGNGVGTTHFGLLYDDKNYYGPGAPLHRFDNVEYFYVVTLGPVGANVQVALGGTFPAPATVGLLALGGLATLRRRRGPAEVDR